MLKILFLAANPTNSSPLRLAAEQRDIEQKLESSALRAEVGMTSVFAARRSDLLLQMNKYLSLAVRHSATKETSNGNASRNRHRGMDGDRIGYGFNASAVGAIRNLRYWHFELKVTCIYKRAVEA